MVPAPIGPTARATAPPPCAAVASLDEWRARHDDDRTDEPDGGRRRSEPWVTKRRLAAHLDVTPRWIEMQQRLGLPRLRVGGVVRYRVSEVEAWLLERADAESEAA